MIRRPRTRPVTVASLVLLGAASILGCATTRSLAPPAGKEATSVARPVDKRISITGYTTRDGVRHDLTGTVEPAGSDSLLFLQKAEPPHGLTAGRPAARIVLPTSEVTSLALPNTGGAVVAGVVFGGVLLAIAYLVMLSVTFTD